MVGGINKQIYLPYQLAQSLGYYKKYGVNMVLSNEVSGGVGAETAMASGQVNMAGAWYVHTINFQLQGKSVVDVAQLSGSPGERIMCATGTHVTSPAQWKGQTIGVTDIGSGTDQLTQYLAARYGLTKGDYTRIGAGQGSTMIAALKNHKILCGMTTQPTVAAIEKLGVGYPAFDLTTTAGVKKWLGGFTPTAGVLALSSWVDANKATVQKVVEALVATMHWLATHSAADVANVLPQSFVSNTLVTKSVYISTLATDKIYDESQGVQPADVPANGKTADLNGGTGTYKLTGKTAGFTDAVVDMVKDSHKHHWLSPLHVGPKLPRTVDSVAGLWFVGDGSTPVGGVYSEAATSAGILGARAMVGSKSTLPIPID